MTEVTLDGSNSCKNTGLVPRADVVDQARRVIELRREADAYLPDLNKERQAREDDPYNVRGMSDDALVQVPARSRSGELRGYAGEELSRRAGDDPAKILASLKSAR